MNTRQPLGIAVALGIALTCHTAKAQDPIIVETTPPPPPPKPKPKPRPTFTTPRPLWRTRIGKVEGTPAVDRGDIYIGADDNVIAL
ncbi:MAG: hypothetical protein SFU56_16715, partial [Capsulimonadales bacterium]|nr:hypothetical protein [Capsulimonadales bacterium]